MVLKIVGGILVVGVSYLLGLYMSKKTEFRIQDLEQLKKAITIFKGEMLYVPLPLSEIFKEISERTNGVVSLLFDITSKKMEAHEGDCAEEIWKKAVIKVMANAYFNSEDEEYILSFGRTLGFSDKEQQVSNALILLSYIDTTQETLREKQKTDERLYKTLGLLCGIMVLIVLY